MKERDAATEKTGKNKYSFCRSNPINKKGAKTFRCAATFLNEFNEISRGERKGFAFEKVLNLSALNVSIIALPDGTAFPDFT